MARPDAVVRGAALLIILLVANGGCAHSECQEVPVDKFSERVSPLLTAVEGPDFPTPTNLATWHERRGDIRASFTEILTLSAGDEARRRAALQALLSAEGLYASDIEAGHTSGSNKGEVRAWARHVMKGYASMGVTPEDKRFVDSSIVYGLEEAWKSEDHPQRNLPLYQEKAAALRGLASFQRSPLCETKP